MQFSIRVQNARLDSIETTIGTAPILQIFSGPIPANCAAASTGTVLSSMTLPVDWMNNASGGTKTKLGTWQQLSASNTGTAGYFRVFDSGGVNCDIQGTVTASGGGGDMIVSTISFVAGASVTVNTFTWTDGNG